jgi:hypothetical protein
MTTQSEKWFTPPCVRPTAEMLRAFCIGHGLTVTAFLDGLGHVLGDHEHDSLSDLVEHAPTLAAALVQARAIDADRRRREPGAPPPPSPSSNGAPASAEGHPGR